jgi:hypothetical protein
VFNKERYEVKNMRELNGDLRRLLLEGSDRIANCSGHEMTAVAEVDGCEMRVCSKCGLSKIRVRAALIKRIPPPYRRSDLDRYIAAQGAYDFSPRITSIAKQWASERQPSANQ